MDTDKTNVIIEKVRAYIKKWHMLDQNDKVAAGVSGGADSVCLLFVLFKLREEFGFELTAVHVNHGLRGEEADHDESYVKSLCEQLGLSCRLCHIDIAKLAAEKKMSVEEAGREARRDAFEQIIREEHVTKIALAHHKNDNAETFLMNLARGTGLKGLGGMRPVNENIIRPLLCLDRAEIEAYMREEGIAYCTDQTNESDAYTRNRVRSHIVPYLEQYVNERTVDHMNETMEQLRGIQDYIDDRITELSKQCVKDCVIQKQEYENIPEVLRKPFLKRVLGKIAGKEKDLLNCHFSALDHLMEKQVGKEISLPYGLRGVRCYEGVRIENSRECSGKQTTAPLALSMEYRVLNREEWERIRGNLENPYTNWFDYDIIKSNLCVRTRMPGDYITIDEDGNRQKLKSYFINEKIPKEQRDSISLLAEGNHILWIAGWRTGCAYRIQDHTEKILEIKLTGGKIHAREN